MSGCLPADASASQLCRDGVAASRLKSASLLAILVASAAGVCLPVVLTRAFRGRAGYAVGLLVIKCYAAGVILATSLVHVLPDAHAALADCHVASLHPWRDFPFAGLASLLGALLALLVDLSASSHMELRHHDQPYVPIGSDAAASTKKATDLDLAATAVAGGGGGHGGYSRIGVGEASPKKASDFERDDVALSAAAAHHDCYSRVEHKKGRDLKRDDVALVAAGELRSDNVLAPKKGLDLTVLGGGCHGHGGEVEVGLEMEVEGEEEDAKRKQKMVSKVLEIGIVFHSVIIGVAMGMSQDVCAIRPLVVALCFHQVFEGMGLGGCIAQAGFGFATVGYMCIMFSVTTPMGILLGMAIFHMTGYDDSSPNALIMEGLLGSLSAGILVYMALVDLIALDFFHNKMMSSSPRLKKACYVALVLGSASMSVLALWA